MIPMFRRSSHCKAGTCVEVVATPTVVLVRDRHGTTLGFTPREWTEFLEGAKNGEFDFDGVDEPP